MNTSRSSLRHNRLCRVAASAGRPWCVGVRVGDPPHHLSRVWARPRPRTHAITAGSKSALLAAAVFLVWLARPLRAEVLDDFSGPRKFAVNGSTSAAVHALADGQLRITVPKGDHFAAAEYLRTYVLLEGQPVEFRTDLVSLDGDSMEAGFWVDFMERLVPSTRTPYYGVWLNYDRIRLWKEEDAGGGSGCVFFDQALSAPTEPLTLSFTFTRLGSSLKIASKVARRDRPEEVVADLEVLDTTGRERTTWGADNWGPPAGPIRLMGLVCVNTEQADMRAEAIFDNVACSVAPTPETVTIRPTASGEVELGWMGYGIALGAESLLGPWRPCTEVVEGEMNRQRIPLSRGRPGRFFRHAAGIALAPVFGSSEDWNIGPSVVGGQEAPRLSVAGGRGRILGVGNRNNEDFVMRFAGAGYELFGIPYGDAVSSVDILRWDAAMEDAAIGLVLRAKPSTILWDCRTDGLPQDRYAGLLTFKKAGSASESVLSLTGPGGEVLERRRFPALDPTRQYRLRFWTVGERLTLELFVLSDLETPIVTCAATDGRIADGLDALCGIKSASGRYDVTINRFVLNAATR